MRVKRAGAILAVLPVLSAFACGFGGLDGVTGGSKDAGTAALDGGVATFEGGAQRSSEGGADDAGTQTYRQLILSDKPVAYFPFDDPPGSATVLEAIKNLQGTINGTGYTFGVDGIAGTALQSDANPYIDYGQVLDFTGMQAWTFEAWIYPTVTPDQAFYEYFNKRDDTTNGIVMYVRNDKGGVTAQLEEDWHGNGGDTGRGVSIALPALDHFIHIVFTYTPGTGVRGWADGFKGTLGYDNPGGPTPTSTSCKIVDSLRGKIDELAVYDYPLSDEQILAHYAKGRLK